MKHSLTTNRHRGFSIIELLFVLLILFALFCLAYPSYHNSIYKKNRKEALIALLQLQLQMEQCFFKNNSYKMPCSLIPDTPFNTPQNNYQISYSSLKNNSYLLTATANTKVNNDIDCTLISINEAHVKTAKNAYGKKSINCWDT